MFFSYPDEVEENRFMWRCGVVDRLNTRDGKVIKVYIKWYAQFFACGESDKTEEILKTSNDKVIKLDIKWDEIFVVWGESDKMEKILKNVCGILAHLGKGRGGRTCENT